MPWFSLAEAQNYSTASDAWTQFLADPYLAPLYNSVQMAGPNSCGGGIDRFCTTSTPLDLSDEYAGRDMAFQAYNRAIMWARLQQPADLAKVVEILEYWMVAPSTRMESVLTFAGNVQQHVFVTAFYAAYNIVKGQPGWTDKPAVTQWIADMMVSSWAVRATVSSDNKRDWLTFSVASAAAAIGDLTTLVIVRDYFNTTLDNRFLADGRVRADYLRNTGLSYSMLALEAICATCEVVYRHLGDNLFVHPGLRLSLQYYTPYAIDPLSWPYSQTTPYTLAQNRAYEFANTRDPQSGYAPILAAGSPFYVDTATGHVTLTNSASAVLSAPSISGISAIVQNGSSGLEAVIDWATDIPTTGVVSWGATVAEAAAPISSSMLQTAHSVILPALVAGGQYYYTVQATSSALVSTSSAQQVFIAVIDVPPVPGTYSDEFNSVTVGAQWTFVDPVGDSSVTAGGTQILIAIPGNVAHDAWDGGNKSARIVHSVPDQDFFMEFRVDSSVTQQYQSQGFLVELDQTNFIRFDFYSDGFNTSIHLGTVISDVATSAINTVIANGSPLYMRVRRTGDVWEQSYSYNGLNWTIVGSITQALAIVTAGLFAGNVGSQPIPAHTAAFDYYRINQLQSTNFTLVVPGSVHSHVAGDVALTQEHQLVIGNALHGHASSGIALTQSHILIVSDALHSLISDSVTLAIPSTAVVPEARIFVVESEGRTYVVTAENRTYWVH